MSAGLRFRGVAETVPGRTTIPVRVPPDLLAEAQRIADQLGEDRSVVLGDLVAAALPAALAEAADDLVGAPARERLGAHLPLYAAAPLPEGKGATVPNPFSHDQVDPDVSGFGLDTEDDPDGVVE